MVGQVETGHGGHGLIADDLGLGLGQSGDAQQEEQHYKSDEKKGEVVLGQRLSEQVLQELNVGDVGHLGDRGLEGELQGLF